MFENIKKLIRQSGDYIPLPEGYDPEIFKLVMERAILQEQQTCVLRTSYHLSQLWRGEENRRILHVILMVEPAYPHLARMADLEIFGDEWLAELATVVNLTMGSVDNLVGQSEQFKQLLREAFDNMKPD